MHELGEFLAEMLSAMPGGERFGGWIAAILYLLIMFATIALAFWLLA
ncbi:MAG: hypothetical protein M3R41_04235 [Pseudomonadota bacterium]|nr:hypothetical protein [Pseudomonadota bacterium]